MVLGACIYQFSPLLVGELWKEGPFQNPIAFWVTHILACKWHKQADVNLIFLPSAIEFATQKKKSTVTMSFSLIAIQIWVYVTATKLPPSKGPAKQWKQSGVFLLEQLGCTEKWVEFRTCFHKQIGCATDVHTREFCTRTTSWWPRKPNLTAIRRVYIMTAQRGDSNMLRFCLFEVSALHFPATVVLLGFCHHSLPCKSTTSL